MMTTDYDFTHRPFGLNQVPNPTKRGIPQEFFGMTAKKAGSLLLKAANKARPANAKTGGHTPRLGGKAATHIGRK